MEHERDLAHPATTTEVIADPAITVVRAVLADGRDLFYFDDAGSRHETPRPPDARALPTRPPTATMRLDPLTGEWVAVATARQGRVMLPPAHLDPLAPQSASNPSEIPGPYDVAVFENRSPSFGPTVVDARLPEPLGASETSAVAAGRCEVISYDPASTGSLAELGSSRMRTVIEAWAQRTAELSTLPGVRQVFPFENRGEQIGVTLHHPHGQIYAYPFVTPRTRRTLDRTREEPGLFAAILDRESVGPRLIAEGDHWSAYVPFAARWPLELHVMPHRHVGTLAHTTLSERAELSAMLPGLLASFDILYDTPTPYMLGWHQAPVGDGTIRLTLTVSSPRRAADKLKFLAGSEAIMGAWVADVSPEDSAARLRDAHAQAQAQEASLR
jgi:UDPglucose--hexose-1-phosphate uridylyltransferase